MDDTNGLVELMSSAINATLLAEKEGMKQYISIIEDLDSMDPVVFEYYDDRGNYVKTVIPVLTIVPISMLHIKEAEFDFALNIGENNASVNTSTDPPELNNQKNVEATNTKKTSVNPSDRGGTPVRSVPDGVRPVSGINTNRPVSAINTNRPVRQKAILKNFEVKLNTSTSSSSSNVTNLKMKIIMGQASIPSGLLEILQAKGNGQPIQEEITEQE